MAKRRGQQTARIVINVTPEQEAAVGEALNAKVEKYNEADSRNDVLLSHLKLICESVGIVWPEHVKHPGKRTDLGK
jgi:hypothetical protein